MADEAEANFDFRNQRFCLQLLPSSGSISSRRRCEVFTREAEKRDLIAKSPSQALTRRQALEAWPSDICRPLLSISSQIESKEDDKLQRGKSKFALVVLRFSFSPLSHLFSSHPYVAHCYSFEHLQFISQLVCQFKS